MRILLRADASPRLGYGHLMRVRSLALTLRAKGASCLFMGPVTGDTMNGFIDAFDDVIHTPDWLSEEDDAAQVAALMSSTHSDLLVVDDYRAGPAYQHALVEHAIEWLQVAPPTADGIWARWIVNASPGAELSSYSRLARRRDARILLGPRYAILRPEFKRPSVARLDSAGPFRLFVSFGGGDDRGALLFAVRALHSSLRDTTMVIVSGESNPNNPLLLDFLSNTANEHTIETHIGSNKIESLMTSSHLAVIGGGITTFEAAACGLPMVLVAVTDNQVDQARAWEKLGAARFLGLLDRLREADLLAATTDLLSDSRLRARFSRRGRLHVDGFGADRIAHELMHT